MAHDHQHGADEGNLKRVLIALVLTGTFMVVEIVGGIISGSLALLADAGHMLTDTMALALAAAAFHVSKRPAGGSLTYGYQRFQILAAFVNGLSLLLIVGWIFYEAVKRFIAPRDILGETMLLVAAAGLVVNIVAFAVLHSGDQENLNIRGAALHVAGDLLGQRRIALGGAVHLAHGGGDLRHARRLLLAGSRHDGDPLFADDIDHGWNMSMDNVPGDTSGLDGRMEGVAGGAAFLLCRRTSRLNRHAGQWALPHK